MKKLIALLLLAPAFASQAQEHAPTKAELQRTFAANDFAKTLIKAAMPAGKNATGSLGFVNDKHQWYCTIDVTGAGAQASVTETDPASPERACVQAILNLSKQHVI